MLVMRGASSMYAIAEESRCYDVAEENGFGSVFARAWWSGHALGNVHTAMWLGGAFSKLVQGADPDADLNFLDGLLRPVNGLGQRRRQLPPAVQRQHDDLERRLPLRPFGCDRTHWCNGTLPLRRLRRARSSRLGPSSSGKFDGEFQPG